MIKCKTCGKVFDDRYKDVKREVNLLFSDLHRHTKETGHHNYIVNELNMYISVG